jgi:hypothetical protein
MTVHRETGASARRGGVKRSALVGLAALGLAIGVAVGYPSENAHAGYDRPCTDPINPCRLK